MVPLNPRRLVLALLAVVLSAECGRSQQRLYRYRSAPVDVPSGSRVVGVNDRGWVAVEGAPDPDYLCRPGFPPLDVTARLPPPKRIAAIGPRGELFGPYNRASAGVDGYTYDAISDIFRGFGSPLRSVSPAVATSDGYVVCYGTNGNSYGQVAFAMAAGYLRHTNLTLAAGATSRSFLISHAASGPWVGLSQFQEYFPGTGWGSKTDKLLAPNGQVITLPPGTQGIQAVSPRGDALVATGVSRQALYSNGSLTPLPHRTPTAASMWWRLMDASGTLYSMTFGPSPQRYPHQVVFVGGTVVRVDALVDDLATTHLGTQAAVSPGGTMLVGAPYGPGGPAQHGSHTGSLVLFPASSPCLALQIDSVGMRWVGRSRSVPVNVTMSMTLLGGTPNHLAAVFVLHPQTLAPLLLVGSSQLDAQGQAVMSINIPPSLQGVSVHLKAFALDPQVGILDSPVRVVSFH